MSDERLPDQLQRLWQAQPPDGTAMSLEQLRERSRTLMRRIGRRNLREYIGAVIVVITFGWAAWVVPSTMFRIGAGLIAAAAIFIASHVFRHGTARAMPADLAPTNCLEFYRGELVRQRDLLRSVWKWAVLPLVPGLIVFYVSQFRVFPEQASRIGWTAAATIVCFVLIAELNRRAAKKIQARIDALERNL